MKLPIPTLMLDNIYQLTPSELKKMGVDLLLLDLDNTLTPYGNSSPSKDLLNWLDRLKKADIEPFILSNNRGDRPANFAKMVGLDYIGHAGKPKTEALFSVLKRKNISPENAAIMGDQIYTDILCGTNAGIISIAVRPISIKNPFRALRFATELPFRLAYKNK